MVTDSRSHDADLSAAKLANFGRALVGKKVVLRPFDLCDLNDTYVGWLNDPEVVKFSNQRFTNHTLQSCRRYFEGFEGSFNLFLSVRLPGPQGERSVGTMTAYRNVRHGTADIGMLIGDRKVWGLGLGLDAFSTLADWLESTAGMRKLTAGTLSCNIGMVRVAEKAGFELEAVRRQQEVVTGEAVDVLHFARFKHNV